MSVYTAPAMSGITRHRTVVDDSTLALEVGQRIRAARLARGLTQQQLASGRYTKAYVSALERGQAKPSMAALNFLADRLSLPASHFLAGPDSRWDRLDADILLASGRWQEAADAYETLAGSTIDSSFRAEVLRGHAEALCRLGRGVEAIRPATESMDLFRRLRRQRDAVLAGYWVANALYLAENTAEARSIVRMLIDQVRGGLEVEPDLEMRLLTAASYIETWDGNHRVAVTYLEQARALSVDLDDRRRAAFSSALASAYFESGDMEGAIRSGNQSLALYRAADAEQEASLLQNNLANAYLELGNLTRAMQLAADAQRGHEREGGDRELATVLDTQARIELAGGNVAAAVELCQRAMASALASANHKALADATVTLARTSVAAGRLQQALGTYEDAAERLRKNGSRARLAEVMGEWADIVATLGDHETAFRLTREALREVTTPAIG